MQQLQLVVAVVQAVVVGSSASVEEIVVGLAVAESFHLVVAVGSSFAVYWQLYRLEQEELQVQRELVGLLGLSCWTACFVERLLCYWVAPLSFAAVVVPSCLVAAFPVELFLAVGLQKTQHPLLGSHRTPQPAAFAFEASAGVESAEVFWELEPKPGVDHLTMLALFLDSELETAFYWELERHAQEIGCLSDAKGMLAEENCEEGTVWVRDHPIDLQIEVVVASFPVGLSSSAVGLVSYQTAVAER